MATITIETKFNVGDKAIILGETSDRALFTVVKILKVQTVVPDINVAGDDTITYEVEVYSSVPTKTKVKIDALESTLSSLAEFEATFNTY